MSEHHRSHASEAKISELFQSAVAPRLRELERERRKALAQSALLLIICVALYIGILHLGGLYETPNSNQFQPWTFGFGIFGAFVFAYLVAYPVRAFKERLTLFLFRALGDMMGPLAYDPAPQEPRIDINAFYEKDLVEGRPKRVKDQLSGVIDGRRFCWALGIFSQRAYQAGEMDTEYVLARSQMKRSLRTGVRIFPRAGRLRDLWRRKMGSLEGVEIHDRAFSERFSVYAEDAEEARLALTPTITFRLMRLTALLEAQTVDKRSRHKMFLGETLAFGFFGDDFLLAVRLSIWSGGRYARRVRIGRPLSEVRDLLRDLYLQISLILEVAAMMETGKGRVFDD